MRWARPRRGARTVDVTRFIAWESAQRSPLHVQVGARLEIIILVRPPPAPLEAPGVCNVHLRAILRNHKRSREVRVVAARTESERPERDDALLEKIAEQTGGEYFVGMQAATDEAAEKPTVVASMKSREQTTYLPGTPDKQFDEMLMTWLMFFIAGVLSLEWLVRRLSKLA